MLTNSCSSMYILIAAMTALSVLTDGSVSAASVLTVSPEAILEMPEGNQLRIFLYLENCTDPTERVNVGLVQVEEPESDRYLDFPRSVRNVTCVSKEQRESNMTVGTPVDLTAKMVSFVQFNMTDLNTGQELLIYSVGVIRPPEQAKDKIFLVGIISMSIFNTLCFGLSLDLDKVKKILKKPISPSIGLFCQFILMPLIAFCLTLAIDRHNAQELGVFVSGVAPGGGASNIWSYLLGGDIDLSITMTFISSLCALAFIPLWMYTLGKYIIGDESIKLPIANMAATLAYIIIPVGIGLAINRFLPKVKKFILKLQKPVILVTVLFAIIMGIYANIYAFKVVLFDYQLTLSGMFLPYTGGLCGLLIGLAFRRPRAEAVTIAIETAIQNTSIATILLRTSLPQPWADISTAVPICLNLFVPVLFQIWFAIRTIYLKCCRKKAGRLSEETVSESLHESPELKRKEDENPSDDHSDGSAAAAGAEGGGVEKTLPPDYSTALQMSNLGYNQDGERGKKVDKFTEL